MDISQGESSGVLRISGAIDINTAETLRSALSDYVEREPNPAVDLAGAEACDATALQLLFAARRSAVQSDRPFHLAALSGAVTETAEALGISLGVLMEGGAAQPAPVPGGRQ